MSQSKSVIISRELLELAMTTIKHSALSSSVSLDDQRAIQEARQAVLEYLSSPESSDIRASDLMIQLLGHQLGDAANYVEDTFEVEGLGDISVIMQKLTGKTPHELRRDAERERDDALASMQLVHEAGNELAEAYAGGFSFQSVLDACKNKIDPAIWNWQKCQKLCDDPLVHEALTTFGHDNTEDNAICLIRTILQRATDPAISSTSE